MGLYCEALAQMDPWTVCCLLLTDGICAGGGVGVGRRAQAGEAMVSILYIPVLIPEETCERASGTTLWEGPPSYRSQGLPNRHLPAQDLEKRTPWEHSSWWTALLRHSSFRLRQRQTPLSVQSVCLPASW